MQMRWTMSWLLLGILFGSADALPTPLYQVGNRATGWTGSPAPHPTDFFLDQVQPIFTRRCVACHGCYEAPCQANFQSYEGILRGFNPEPIYGSRRTRPTYPTRMSDAKTVEEWRTKGFLPVVEEDYPQSLLQRFVTQSQRNNEEGFPVMRLQPLQDAIDADKNACVATDSQYDAHLRAHNPWGAVSFTQFISAYPYAGMPLGLPRLTADEAETLRRWQEKGAPGPSAEARRLLDAPAHPEVIRQWETELLNLDTPRARLSARYIYEHLFTAVVAFAESPGEFYELVRSRTEAGAIDEIVTSLPYDPPGAPRVYYRFRKLTRALVQKTQILWRVSAPKLAHLKQLFLESEGWPSEITDPGYGSNNAFVNFAQIPGTVRARFMIENAKAIIGAMVQGSVCVGSRATYAISDHFWVWFLKPESDVSALQPMLGLKSWEPFGMAPLTWNPTSLAGRVFKKGLAGLDAAALVARLGLEHLNAVGLVRKLNAQLDKHGISGTEALDAVLHFLRTVKAHHTYQYAYERTLRLWLRSQGRTGLSVSDLWSGDGGDPMYPDGKNPNAWLNVTRHELSATVQFGEEGGKPQSIWVLSYSNFERLYYNLVAAFEPWGSLQHRLATWRGMSYVRLEAEDLAISFLPREHREEIRREFARGILGAALNRDFFPHYSLKRMTDGPRRLRNFFRRDELPIRTAWTYGVHGRTAWESVHLLVNRAKQSLGGVAVPAAAIQSTPADRRHVEDALNLLTGKSLASDGARYPRFFPNILYLRVVKSPEESWIYTILADRAYKAHNIVFLEDLNREPERDSLGVYRGFVGAYPNLFLEVALGDIDRLVSQLGGVVSEDDFLAVAHRWGIARNSRRFWPFFDWLHAYKASPRPEIDPDEQGIVDLSQYLYFEE